MAQRIESVDLLRGITVAAMILVNTPGSWSYVYPLLLHAEWHGLTPTDLIFPFFLFIVGISISFAYKKASNDSSTFKKITKRSLKLIGLGLFLNAFIPYFPFITDLSTIRIPGVLQRIGLVFFFSALLFLNCHWKTLIYLFFAILLSYWILLGFVSLPDGSLPSFDRVPNNWANYIDVQLFGKHNYQADYDPEGLLSTVPSIATAISGILIGKILSGMEKQKNFYMLLISGLVLWLTGQLWNHYFPINKALWSSSFVLVTSGWATVLLAVVYYFTDIQQIKFGRIFKHVGTNAISIYFLSSLLSKCFYLIELKPDTSLHGYLFENLPTIVPDHKLASLLYALTVVAFYLYVGYFMYRRKWIIKV